MVKLHKIAATAEPGEVVQAVGRWQSELEKQRHLNHVSFSMHLGVRVTVSQSANEA